VTICNAVYVSKNYTHTYQYGGGTVRYIIALGKRLYQYLSIIICILQIPMSNLHLILQQIIIKYSSSTIYK